MAEFAAASGAGQKAGVALATTGLILTVAMPGTGAMTATADSSQAASAVGTQPEIPAAASATIDFSRAAVSTTADPDSKLKQLLSAQSVGTIKTSSSKGTLGAPLDTLTTASPFGYRVNPITGGLGSSTAARTSWPSAAPRSMLPRPARSPSPAGIRMAAETALWWTMATAWKPRTTICRRSTSRWAKRLAEAMSSH
ncbi:peptidase [Arthrobacter sp. Hiyo8]|nr:peptidase [Arthrobacter sp. Hiyo8]